MTTTDPWAACDHDPTSTTAAPAAQPTTAATLELARADASAPRPAHHLHVVALGSAQHMQQTHLAGPAHPHAHRVVTAVQRAHRRLQRLTVLGGGQRIPVGPHHDPRATAAMHPKPAVAVAADRALPDRAVIGLRSTHNQRLEPRQFRGVHPRIHQQP